MGEVEFIAEKIRSSYLYDEVNSILTKYKMSIDDIDIIEPTLLFTKEKFLEVYRLRCGSPWIAHQIC